MYIVYRKQQDSKSLKQENGLRPTDRLGPWPFHDPKMEVPTTDQLYVRPM